MKNPRFFRRPPPQDESFPHPDTVFEYRVEDLGCISACLFDGFAQKALSLVVRRPLALVRSRALQTRAWHISAR